MFGAVIYVISLQQMAVNKAHQSQSKAIEQRTMLCVCGDRPGTQQHLSDRSRTALCLKCAIKSRSAVRLILTHACVCLPIKHCFLCL